MDGYVRIAFQVNQTKGTQDTIDKARQKGIAVKIFSYSLKEEG